jgi:hypothetical protein
MAKPQLVRLEEHVLRFSKYGCIAVIFGIASLAARVAIKPRPPRTSAFGALVSSLEVLQSMEVPHRETSLTLSTFRYTFSFLFTHRANPLVAT